MKLQFRHQSFQADAAKAVCDVFAGQPLRSSVRSKSQWQELFMNEVFGNAPITVPDDRILKQIQEIQRNGQIKPSDKLEGRYNLTIEMETGVGKTYTYIKTMYELNKYYGWSKFIIVVPSVAIREGVYKSFRITEDHFAEEYGEKIRYFIYNSDRLADIKHFASDSFINVMIINMQAFNSDNKKIDEELDDFNSRKPIDTIAQTHPILIIDEPQSVEGDKTKMTLEKFCPLFTLRYSATHKKDSIYNMIYRLDALDAYNKRLVKKIAVKGCSFSESTGEGYIYIQRINLSKGNPTATIEFETKGGTKITQKAGTGYDLFEKSGKLSQYEDGWIVSEINGRDSSVTFINGRTLKAGDVIGKNKEYLHRVQISETIKSHIEREKQLFSRGIKTLSLFFIDEVAKYKRYDNGNATGGIYAKMFEEEYNNVISSQDLSDTPEYAAYIKNITAESTHAGYFAIDKKGRITDKLKGETVKKDAEESAYQLIMCNKERLLDLAEPVRFIFSHSALKEGWDNPNVFQICTLKQGKSEVRKRQEVGRGLRLCVNKDGERMDENVLSHNEIHDINVLTVIANESYDKFVEDLQKDMAEATGDRLRKVKEELFVEKFGEERATDIYDSLVKNGYCEHGALTEKYYEDKRQNAIKAPIGLKDRLNDIIAVLDTIYNPDTPKTEDARKTVEATLRTEKLNSPAFRELWKRINSKSSYIVDIDEKELVKEAVIRLSDLTVSQIHINVECGEQKANATFIASDTSRDYENYIKTAFVARYDLVGRLAKETWLRRKTIVNILSQMPKEKIALFADNPEEFIRDAVKIIKAVKAKISVKKVTYNKLNDTFGIDLFREASANKGQLDYSAIRAEKHLYEHVIYDSETERKFAEELERHGGDVEVYVKLPGKFHITTPVGKYNPDWAIAFRDKNNVKHIYFVAETKGSAAEENLREIEKYKKICAERHFAAIGSGEVRYKVVDTYKMLEDATRG